MRGDREREKEGRGGEASEPYLAHDAKRFSCSVVVGVGWVFPRKFDQPGTFFGCLSY
jgi:hypothetical protein